ncbi:hypothetical protein M404DRAFT_629720 [Pisolithus tinctorius Marx 270]|uniref:Uncharacterized protein n=1 Tax=Pisolithus tinctorius Marx 270 TaxID=870435 RepID=A0A0C3P6J9_PISTI|nr:hypothetical protein M404DRAFT_629720 [Pisolithus tinctorius Marx 270]
MLEPSGRAFSSFQTACTSPSPSLVVVALLSVRSGLVACEAPCIITNDQICQEGGADGFDLLRRSIRADDSHMLRGLRM